MLLFDLSEIGKMKENVKPLTSENGTNKSVCVCGGGVLLNSDRKQIRKRRSHKTRHAYLYPTAGL